MSQLSNVVDVQGHVMAAVRRPSHLIHPLVGTPGYELPFLETHEWREIKAGAFPNLEVKGQTSGTNWLFIEPGFVATGKMTVHLSASSDKNVIILGRATKTSGDFYLLSSGCLIILCENDKQFSPIFLRTWTSNQLLFWGHGSTSNGVHVHIQGEEKSVIIGEDCMFSSGITIRNSDMHAVVDMRTGELTNPPGNIVVEPHVWVGQDALVGRRVVLGMGSIIGAKAVASKDVPRFTTVAGVPAKVIKQEVTWDRKQVPAEDLIARLRELEERLV